MTEATETLPKGNWWSVFADPFPETPNPDATMQLVGAD